MTLYIYFNNLFTSYKLNDYSKLDILSVVPPLVEVLVHDVLPVEEPLVVLPPLPALRLRHLVGALVVAALPDVEDILLRQLVVHVRGGERHLDSTS